MAGRPAFFGGLIEPMQFTSRAISNVTVTGVGDLGPDGSRTHRELKRIV
jgi:hypothetical protein